MLLVCQLCKGHS